MHWHTEESGLIRSCGCARTRLGESCHDASCKGAAGARAYDSESRATMRRAKELRVRAHTTRRVVPLCVVQRSCGCAHDSESRTTGVATDSGVVPLCVVQRSCGCARHTTRRVVPLCVVQRSCGCARIRLGESCHYASCKGAAGARAHTTRRVVPLCVVQRSCGCGRAHDSESRATMRRAKELRVPAHTTRRVVPLCVVQRSCGCARTRLGESCHYASCKGAAGARAHDSESRATMRRAKELRVRAHTTRRVVPLCVVQRSCGCACTRLGESCHYASCKGAAGARCTRLGESCHYASCKRAAGARIRLGESCHYASTWVVPRSGLAGSGWRGRWWWRLCWSL